MKALVGNLAFSICCDLLRKSPRKSLRISTCTTFIRCTVWRIDARSALESMNTRSNMPPIVGDSSFWPIFMRCLPTPEDGKRPEFGKRGCSVIEETTFRWK
ncbi:hypothetical protein HNY73_007065 [Argiope bruennichi]|uniref:Uncharacterized protein n=1 Tax=Argiope bruennichi TaxID=94029 RepID=A0A8T0FDU5_ARGBR|nr:hypothetical protein HNY73_007065 [Argiope bruennichi]